MSIAIHALYFAVVATLILPMFMWLFRKSSISLVESVALDTASPQRAARARRSKAFWKKTLLREQRRARKAQDTEICLMHENQEQQEDTPDLESEGMCAFSSSSFLEVRSPSAIRAVCTNVCITAEAKDSRDHVSEDDQSEGMQPHDVPVFEVDVILSPARRIPVADIASEDTATNNDKIVCKCGQSGSWGCVRHRAYTKELLLAQRSRSAMPRDIAGAGGDGFPFFALLAEPPGLERWTRAC